MKLYLLTLLTLLTSCGSHYKTPIQGDPLFKHSRSEHDTRKLTPHAERHTRRGNYLIADGDFERQEAEPYSHYIERIKNTLKIQRYEIRTLQATLNQKADAAHELDTQLAALSQTHDDLRLALAGEKPVNSTMAATAARPLFERYVVKKGDTLQKIARRMYGTHTAWLGIYRFNTRNLPYGPNKIEVGDVLFLPDVPAN